MPTTGTNIEGVGSAQTGCQYISLSLYHLYVNRTFAADLSPNNQIFSPGVKFVMRNGEPVPYDPLTFYHGVLVG